MPLVDGLVHRSRAADQLDKLVVRLELAKFLRELFHGIHRLHRREGPAEHCNCVQHVSW